jgi:carbamoyl-phosphate synthase large subunit
MKFLITGANGDIAISISRIIKDEFKNSVVEGTDIIKEGPGEYLYKKIYKVPNPNNKNYLSQIKKVSRDHNVIIPTTENEIKFFSKNYNKFKKKIVLINSQFIINTFSSKVKTYQFLKKNKFGVPNFCFKLNNLKKFKKSFFLKLDTGHGNKNYDFINSSKKFKELNKLDKKKWVAQEFLGNEYQEYTCAIIRLNNFEDAIILNRRLNKGYSYYAEVVENTYLRNILLNLAEKINLEGSINVQLKINKKRYAIFEINPRLSSTVMMRHKMGFKDCVWWINYNLRKKIPKFKSKIKKIKMIKFFSEKFI